MDSIEHEAAPPNFLSEGAANVYQALKTATHGGNTLKHEHANIQAMTIREIGKFAAESGVRPSSLLPRCEPQRAPSTSAD
jgi:hypothetical protein